MIEVNNPLVEVNQVWFNKENFCEIYIEALNKDHVFYTTENEDPHEFRVCSINEFYTYNNFIKNKD
jgi:hypothetical protein